MTILQCSTPLEGAQWATRNGFYIHPLRGKIAIWKGWQQNAILDPDKLLPHLQNGGNYGIATELSGLVVIDEDKAGEFSRWAEKHGHKIPQTLTVETAHGTHFYFKRFEGATNASPFRKEGFEIDVRGQGYVVGAGSIHPTEGTIYTLKNDVEPAECPKWLQAYLTAETAQQPLLQPATTPPSYKSHLQERVTQVIQELQALQTLPLGAKDQHGKGWDTATFSHACHLVKISNTDPVNYPLGKAEQDFLTNAPTDHTFNNTKHEHQWISALREVGADKLKNETADLIQRLAKVGQNQLQETTQQPQHQNTLNDPQQAPENSYGRRLEITPASLIKPVKVNWLWDEKYPLGALSLLSGRQGLGKSTLAMWIAAQITLGTLPGDLFGAPKNVIIAATEDTWEHTITPRLMAAGANLEKVFKVEAHETTDGVDWLEGINIERDIHRLKDLIKANDVALVILDPLTSRLGDRDTHKDSETRKALEPIARLAEETGAAVIGLMHFNKGATDPTLGVMGSTAFTAVARAVGVVASDPEDDTGRKQLFAISKSNLGRISDKTLAFMVANKTIFNGDEMELNIGAIEWAGESNTSLRTAMTSTPTDGADATLIEEACEWLEGFLTLYPNSGKREVYNAAKKEAITERTLERAAKKIGVEYRREGFPAKTFWSLSPQSRQPQKIESKKEPAGATGVTGLDLGKQSKNMAEKTQSRQTSMSGGTGENNPKNCPECNTPTCAGECVMEVF